MNNNRVEAIDRLFLPEAFSTNVHMPFDECWTVRTDSKLLVIDDNQSKLSVFSNEESDICRALVIQNLQNKEIVLLSVDNRLLSNIQGGIADCALLDTCKFYFVEFKTNALGNSDKAVRDTFDTACKQLKNTLMIFAERLANVGIEFLNMVEVSCKIVVSESFPKSKATKQEYRVAFLEKNGIPLDFKNTIEWN